MYTSTRSRRDDAWLSEPFLKFRPRFSQILFRIAAHVYRHDLIWLAPLVCGARDFGYARKLLFQNLALFPKDNHDRSIVSPRAPVPVVLMAADRYWDIGAVYIDSTRLAVIAD